MTTVPAHPLTASYWQRGCDFLGSQLAILCGAMTWVSERNLVSAFCNAGGFGVLACGAMTPDLLRAEIKATRALTTAHFGVNLIIMHPALDELVDVCGEEGVSHVALAGGVPRGTTIAKLNDYGIKVICFAPNAALAKRMVRAGAGALVIEGMEAGGHIGPVATSVLAQEILPVVTDVPVFVAGGIGHGEAIGAYLAMGAAGVQMGTRFVCADECIAHDAFKKAFIRGSARDAVPSVQIDPQFKVIPVRALQNDGTRGFTDVQVDVIRRHRAGEMSFEEASLAIEHYWAGALRRAVIDGDVETGSLMAGQSVGFVKKTEPVRETLAALVLQTEQALGRRMPAVVTATAS